MCCMQLAEYTGCKVCHLRTAVSTPRVLTIYGELQPTNGSDRLAGLGHPSKFQRVSRLGFVTAMTSLNSGQPNFARCLAISSAGTLYIHFGGSCPLMAFCQVQNSLCVQVLWSSILATLLHRIRAVAGRPSHSALAHILVCVVLHYV